jgi:hypothetical protein
LDLLLLFADELRKAVSNIDLHHTEEGTLLETEGGDEVLEVIGILELSLEFLTPFRENSQNLRILDLQAMRFDFLLREQPRGFWEFLSDFVGGVLPHLLLIAGFLFLLDFDILILEQILIERGLLLKHIGDGIIEQPSAIMFLLREGLLVMHPLVISNRLKQEHHLVLKAFIDSLILSLGLDLDDDFIEGPHDEIVVLSTLPVLEVDF